MPSPSDEGTVVSEQTAPETGAVEQPITQQSFEDLVIQDAINAGTMEAPKSAEPEKAQEETAQDAPEEVPSETETPELPLKTEGEKEEQEQPAASKDKLDKLVPLREVIEERTKKQRANERADTAEIELRKREDRIRELETQLTQASGPVPTPDNPLIDIQEPRVLDRLERVYEAIEEVDIENVNEDGTVALPASIGQDGRLVYQNIPADQARLAQKRAERVLRKDIPQRRQYLDERAKIDAGTVEWYPDLKQSDHEFTRLVNQLSNTVLSGKAMNDPQVKFWAANAVYGFIKRREEAQASNGAKTSANGVKEIVSAARQKVAPTAPRTRSLQERKSGADLAQKEKEFEKNPSPEKGDELVAAILSGNSSQKTVQRVAE